MDQETDGEETTLNKRQDRGDCSVPISCAAELMEVEVKEEAFRRFHNVAAD
jgi:hypothetical protein